jgi:hypothetical protein
MRGLAAEGPLADHSGPYPLLLIRREPAGVRQIAAASIGCDAALVFYGSDIARGRECSLFACSPTCDTRAE